MTAIYNQECLQYPQKGQVLHFQSETAKDAMILHISNKLLYPNEKILSQEKNVFGHLLQYIYRAPKWKKRITLNFSYIQLYASSFTRNLQPVVKQIYAR